MSDSFTHNGATHEDAPGTTTTTAATMPPPATSSTCRPPKKRRRPALSCEQCRRRKIRCDRKVPCSHCTRSGIAACSYIPTHVPASWAKRKTQQSLGGHHRLRPEQEKIDAPSSAPRRRIPPAPTSSSKGDWDKEALSPQSIREDRVLLHPVSRSSQSVANSVGASTSRASNNVDWLVTRIHHLEEKLSKVVTISNHSGGAEEASPPGTESSAPITGTVSKTRYFGRGHWMNGAILLSLEMALLHRVETGKGELASVFSRCKALGRAIKDSRLSPLSSVELGRTIPSRDLADQLVEAYLRTFEGVLRIVHVPTFRAEYERYWQNRDAASDSFTILLQLVMALGAVFHDDTFTLRSLAIQWAYEAQLWLMLPPEKRRMTIAGIQIMCLLTLARSVCAVGQDIAWVTAGGLVRRAMYMGMHRDPKHLADMTTYRAEMRRRLWATVMELNLQSSFDAGGPPLISNLEHDVQPPANLDDNQLTDELDKEREAKMAAATTKPKMTSSDAPVEAVTQMTLPLELYRSLPLRLNLLRHANDFRSEDSYDETLRFNSELTKACRSLSRAVAILTKSQQGRPSPCATDFHASTAELLLYRCFHTLHQPVISRSLNDPKFYFSRKMYLDGALKITHICGLSGSRRGDGPGGRTRQRDPSDFDRLITNGSGMFRNVPVQSLPSLVMELLHSTAAGLGPVQSPLGMGLGYLPAVHDYDLRATLEAGMTWALRRIQSGETNTKVHCFFAACLGHVKAAEAGMDQAGTEAEIVRLAEEAAHRCWEAIKALAEKQGIPTAGEQCMQDEVLGMPAVGLGINDLPMDFMGDWSWEDMGGMVWGSPPPFDDRHPPIFG